MIVTDLFLGLHSTVLFVYGGVLAAVVIGQLWLRPFRTGRFLTTSLVSALAFYLISNFGVWYVQSLYPHTWAGLMTCYVAGLPFIADTVLSTVIYGGVTFAAWQVLERSFVSLRPESFVTQA
jgi:hypothetical protein